MLLAKLKEFIDGKSDDCPPNYEITAVKWIVNLSNNGDFLGITRSVNNESDKKDKGELIPIPALPKKRAGSKPASRFLVDKAQYIFGVDDPAETKDRKTKAIDLHRMFLQLLNNCFISTQDTALKAVLAFLEQTANNKPALPVDFSFSDLIAFKVDNELITSRPQIQNWWINNAVSSEDPIVGICSCCGEKTNLCKRLPQPIKGIGGQASGPMLISVNEKAYSSYGLDNALTSPTCFACGEGFGKALNYLVKGENSKLRIADLTYVFWSKANPEFSVLNYLNEPTEESVKLLFQSAFTAQDVSGSVSEEDFNAIAVSASSSRVVIRDWVDTTISMVKKSLKRWFSMMYLPSSFADNTSYRSIYQLAASLYRKGKDIEVMVPQVLLKCAINGGALPDWLLYKIIKRNRAEQKVTDARVSLIKLVFLSQKSNFKEDEMTELDVKCVEPGYLSGRLFAVLESIQRISIKGAKSTIMDRYYGSASSNPASVFGLLLRLAQTHLSKLRKNSPKIYSSLNLNLTDILAELKEFPSALTLKEQAMFALGYYHQKDNDRKRALKFKELASIAEPEEDTLFNENNKNNGGNN